MEKDVKMPGDIILSNMCTKNEDHMIYGFSAMDSSPLCNGQQPFAAGSCHYQQQCDCNFIKHFHIDVEELYILKTYFLLV